MPVSPVTQRTSNGSMPSTSATMPRARRRSPARSRSRRRTRSPARCDRAGAARPSAAACSSRSAAPRRTGTRRRRGRGRGRRGACRSLLLPARALDDLPDALGEADRADAQPVRGQRVRLGDHLEAQLRRVEPSFSAILSSWTSWPKRGCGVPCPRFGPHGGLFVNVRHASNRSAGSGRSPSAARRCRTCTPRRTSRRRRRRAASAGASR